MCPNPGSPITPERADQCRISRKLGASKQGQPFRDDFQTSAINAWNLRQIEVTDHDVRRNPGPSPSANACHNTTAKPLRPRAPETTHADGWWPKLSRRRPHRQTRVWRGNGNRSCRKNNVQKNSESMRATATAHKEAKKETPEFSFGDTQKQCTIHMGGIKQTARYKKGCDDLQSASAPGNWHGQMEVSQQHVGCNPGASFPTHACGHSRWRIPVFPKPRSRARTATRRRNKRSPWTIVGQCKSRNLMDSR